MGEILMSFTREEAIKLDKLGKVIEKIAKSIGG